MSAEELKLALANANTRVGRPPQDFLNVIAGALIEILEGLEHHPHGHDDESVKVSTFDHWPQAIDPLNGMGS